MVAVLREQRTSHDVAQASGRTSAATVVFVADDVDEAGMIVSALGAAGFDVQRDVDATSPPVEFAIVRLGHGSERAPDAATNGAVLGHGTIAVGLPEELARYDLSPFDDLLVLPVTGAEVMARVQRAISRRGLGRDVVTRGLLRMDVVGRRAYVRDGEVDLTFREYELLLFLVLHEGEVFDRATLLERVWGSGYHGGLRTVDVHIRRLRSKIEIGGTPLIETVRNVGYAIRRVDGVPPV